MFTLSINGLWAVLILAVLVIFFFLLIAERGSHDKIVNASLEEQSNRIAKLQNSLDANSAKSITEIKQTVLDGKELLKNFQDTSRHTEQLLSKALDNQPSEKSQENRYDGNNEEYKRPIGKSGLLEKTYMKLFRKYRIKTLGDLKDYTREELLQDLNTKESKDLVEFLDASLVMTGLPFTKDDLDYEKHKTVIEKPEKKTNLSFVGLSARALNALSAAGFKYVEDLDGMSRASIFRIRNIGKRAMKEIDSMMDKMGYTYGD